MEQTISFSFMKKSAKIIFVGKLFEELFSKKKCCKTFAFSVNISMKYRGLILRGKKSCSNRNENETWSFINCKTLQSSKSRKSLFAKSRQSGWCYFIGFTRCFLFRSQRRIDCKEGVSALRLLVRAAVCTFLSVWHMSLPACLAAWENRFGYRFYISF